jgi:hypothetical protein
MGKGHAARAKQQILVALMLPQVMVMTNLANDSD